MSEKSELRKFIDNIIVVYMFISFPLSMAGYVIGAYAFSVHVLGNDAYIIIPIVSLVIFLIGCGISISKAMQKEEEEEEERKKRELARALRYRIRT